MLTTEIKTPTEEEMKKANLFDEAENELGVITSPMATVSSP